MAIGAGKYDQSLTVALKSSGASTGVLIIFDGNKGSGVSVQAPWLLVEELPKILRALAAEIEEDQNAFGRS